MENPIKRLRKESGLSARAFAVSHGVNLYSLRAAEAGNASHLPKSLRLVLEASGLDTEKLDAEYTMWLEEKVSEELEAIRGKA